MKTVVKIRAPVSYFLEVPPIGDIHRPDLIGTLYAETAQILRHPGLTVKQGIHLLFVDLLHQFFVVRTIFKGRIVEAASVHIQQLTPA